MKALKLLPKISETERTALKAGNVWMETELFSGKPNFGRLMSQPYPELSADEQAFIDGPVNKVCDMTDDWKVVTDRDLSPEVWQYLKDEKFFGMIVPKAYEGREVSAMGHSEVVMKLASRSVTLAITAMVPNSLGPAELLNHYGTEEQKNTLLPRLAKGQEIPCFALTEPRAGSDAASMVSEGTVFKGEDGKLYIKLNWNKRWITLAAISTIVGLAFRLYDPENLLGKGQDIGITCALVPANTPGVQNDKRHDPLSVPFYNCPTRGENVVVPIDAIIGGQEMAGRGWEMLMESLAAGRGISLPGQATAGAKYFTRVASAHATVRKQFGLSIGKFEGIAEPLARLAGLTYLMEATRKYTCGAIDTGIKPPVVTAIAKYNLTELQRIMVNDAMDITGGQGISRGPKNLLANAYFSTPIPITVEGANIMTRTLIIFGQGALRAHPYAFKEVEAVENNDLAAFDKAFWAHIGHVFRNKIRAGLLFLTRGWLAEPFRLGPTGSYFRKMAWASATFAFMADMAMGLLGGSLKTREKITGRFADVLSWMYLGTSTLRRWEAEGRRKEDLPYVHWSMKYTFQKIHDAFEGIFSNFDAGGPIGWIFKGPVRWLWRLNSMGVAPSDKEDLLLAKLIQIPGEQRNRMLEGTYLSKDRDNDQLAKLEYAFELAYSSDKIFRKVRKAVKKGQLKKKASAELYKDALAASVITQDEYTTLDKADKVGWDVIQVDEFGLDEYLGKKNTERSAAASSGKRPDRTLSA